VGDGSGGGRNDRADHSSGAHARRPDGSGRCRHPHVCGGCGVWVGRGGDPE
jgi:hypothetical protein